MVCEKNQGKKYIASIVSNIIMSALNQNVNYQKSISRT